jgi:hypothetical protein
MARRRCSARARSSAARPVPTHHLSRPPAGQTHQVRLLPAVGEPLVGESAAEAVRVDVRNAGITGAPVDHLPDRVVGHRPQSRPQGGSGGVPVSSTRSNVATQRISGFGAVRTGPMSSSLAQHVRGRILLIKISYSQPGQLPGSHARIQEKANHRQIATVLEGVAPAGRKQCVQISVGDDQDGPLWNGRRAYPLHRRTARSHHRRPASGATAAATGSAWRPWPDGRCPRGYGAAAQTSRPGRSPRGRASGRGRAEAS